MTRSPVATGRRPRQQQLEAVEEEAGAWRLVRPRLQHAHRRRQRGSLLAPAAEPPRDRRRDDTIREPDADNEFKLAVLRLTAVARRFVRRQDERVGPAVDRLAAAVQPAGLRGDCCHYT